MRRVCAVVEASHDPTRNPLLPPLAAELRRRGIRLATWDPTRSAELPPSPPAAELYLLKADDPAALAAAACLHDAGASCLNAYEATEAVQNKARTFARLVAAGVPVPPTRLVGDTGALAEELERGPRFVKPLRGAHGLGVRRLGTGEADAAGAPPWLVQEVVGNGRPVVLKVYGVGARAALRRMRFRPGVVDARREPVEPEAELLDAARRAAAAAGLVCYGADFVAGADGPVLVDLNAFPGYRTVDEAPAWLADAIEERLAC